MNRLEQEITTLKNRLDEIEWNLVLSNESNYEAVRNQEQMEHRINNLEESNEDLGKKVMMLREDVVLIGEYLNNAITRINDLHRCLNELADKDLWCNEKMGVSDDDDDDDDEFDLDDCSEKIDLELHEMKNNDSMNN